MCVNCKRNGTEIKSSLVFLPEYRQYFDFRYLALACNASKPKKPPKKKRGWLADGVGVSLDADNVRIEDIKGFVGIS